MLNFIANVGHVRLVRSLVGYSFALYCCFYGLIGLVADRLRIWMRTISALKKINCSLLKTHLCGGFFVAAFAIRLPCHCGLFVVYFYKTLTIR